VPRVCASARQQLVGDKAPQSNFVRLHHSGLCIWWPMYEESVSHCPISVTRFPFDEQHCNFDYESWKYNGSQLVIRSELMSLEQSHFQESEQWQLLGT